MTPRWYHSRLFWLGLTGLLMLCGAGKSFEGRISQAGWTGKDRAFGIIGNPDAVVLVHVDPRHPDLAGLKSLTSGFHTLSWDAGSTPTLWVPAVRLEREGSFTRITFAIWFILLLYSVVWFGGMVWWLRRKHRLMTNPPHAAAAVSP